jgi:hypothetical protein
LSANVRESGILLVERGRARYDSAPHETHAFSCWRRGARVANVRPVRGVLVTVQLIMRAALRSSLKRGRHVLFMPFLLQTAFAAVVPPHTTFKDADAIANAIGYAALLEISIQNFLIHGLKKACSTTLRRLSSVKKFVGFTLR